MSDAMMQPAVILAAVLAGLIAAVSLEKVKSRSMSRKSKGRRRTAKTGASSR